MDILLTNKLQISCSLEEWIELKPKLDPYIIVENGVYVNNLNLGLSVKDIPTELNLAQIEYVRNKSVHITAPVGLWDFIKHLFTIEARDTRKRYRGDIFSDLLPYKVLYDYQKTAVREMVKFNNGILKAKPGSGKTIMGLTLAAIIANGGSVLWINDRIDLCKQAMKTAVEKLGFTDCGLLQGDNENVSRHTFTTIQKLSKVLNFGFNDVTQNLRHFDVIIIDECHHCVGSFNDYQQYFQVLNELNYTHVYGLTATEKRVDGNEHLVFSILGPVRYEVVGSVKTLEATVENKHCHINTTEAIYESFVNKYTGKAMPASVDSYLLFHDEYVKFFKPYIDEAISKFKKVLIVSPRIAGAQFVSDYLKEQNIEHFLVYGAIKKRERMYTDKVLVATIDLVKEGFDVPDLEAIIVLSREIHKFVKTQIVGRCERFVEGKPKPHVWFLIPHMKRFERNKVKFEELSLDDI